MARRWPTLRIPIATLAGGCLALVIASAPVAAADPELAALERATMLLATRGHRIAPVVLLEIWPSAAPSLEAFAALRGTIYVNARSNILRAAVRSREYDVVLASLLLHEQSHVLGGNEQQALETELGWLMSERARGDVIQAMRRSIEGEKQKGIKGLGWHFEKERYETSGCPGK